MSETENLAMYCSKPPGCICRKCLFHESGRCPYGSCYDDLRAKENPYDKAHPDKPSRTSWSKWNEEGEQAHWCRGGMFYQSQECPSYEEYDESKHIVRECFESITSTFQDGYISCSIVESVGCEECMRRAKERRKRKKEDPMTTYYTKCGIPFEKSSNAVVTGSPVPEKDGKIASDKCAACPWPVEVKEGYGANEKHKRWECRAGSEPPNHTTEWRGSLNDKNTLNIYSLDVALMTEIIAFAQGHPDLSAAYNADSMADCRRTISVSCASNKKGMAAKKELIEKFFPAEEATEVTESCRTCLNSEIFKKANFAGSWGNCYKNKGRYPIYIPDGKCKDWVTRDEPQEAAPDKTYSVGICDHCVNYDPTGEDLGICELTNKPVSRVRPGCESFDADIFDDDEDIGSMDLEDQLNVLLEQGDEADRVAKENPQGCPKYDCPFHVYEDEGCDFNREERTRDQDHGSWYKDVRVAVEEYGCEVPKVLMAHKTLADEEMASEAEVPESVNETPEIIAESPESANKTAESVNDSIPDVIKPAEVEQTPAFDYSEVDHDTADFLQEKANRITEIRIKSVIAIGRELKEAQDRLANHGNGTFERWYGSVGLKKDSVYRDIRAYEWILANCEDLELAENIQPSLLFEVSKPSAPPELQQEVVSGNIAKHKDYQEALKRIKRAEEALEAQKTIERDYRKRLEEVERQREESAKSYQDESKRVQELVNDQVDRNRKIFDLENQIEQMKQDSSPARIEQQNAQIYELQKQLDQARKDLTDAQDEAQELEKQLSAKPVTITAEIVKPKKAPDELLPCPFCGGKAEYHQFANPKNSYTVACTVCRCQTYGYDCPSDSTHAENKAMQAEIWNRRKGGTDR